MKNCILVTGVAVLAIGFSASLASAQCANSQHPKKAGALKSSLTQAFVSCGNPGGNTPNATTESGVPSCAPSETYHEQALSPPQGWRWDPDKGQGSVSFKATKNKLTPGANRADLAIQIKMSGILDNGGIASGTPGYLLLLARMSVQDPVGGPMTIVDFPFGLALQVVNGRIVKKTSLNAVLVQVYGQPPLPDCSTIDILSVDVRDPNGNIFAQMGMFLPDN
jgi:hypothetical protein